MPDALHFKIHGMDCAEEVGILKRELRDLVGNESNLSFDILNGPRRRLWRSDGHDDELVVHNHEIGFERRAARRACRRPTDSSGPLEFAQKRRPECRQNLPGRSRF
jgi:hypothetical protein